MRGSVLLLCALLSACAVQPVALPRPDHLFNDAAFRAPSIPLNTDVFAVSDAMRNFLHVQIGAQLRGRGRMPGLIDALQNRAQLKLEYDSSGTRTAAEAFDARAGNCISLVIMAAAMARELGLYVNYQRVFAEETWSRDGDLSFGSGHVNLALQEHMGEWRVLGDPSGERTIDFLPPEEIRGYRTRPIEEPTVVAMYMNNRAAESLARGQLDDAYWWAREAILRDGGLLEAYNTLGVIYRRHGNLHEAERVFRHLLEGEPRNPTVMSNLAAVLTSAGQPQAAQALLQELKRIEPYAPFHFLDRGQLALKNGNYRSAIDLFKKELARDPSYHVTHFGLALAYLQLGDLATARKHLAEARQNSTTRREHELYAAKLDRLSSYPSR